LIRTSEELATAGTIGRIALRALYAEFACAPKPGLVTPADSGSHEDMDADTFMRSLFSLRHYFSAVASAGMRGASFRELQRLGIAAEARMFCATRGVNTHCGAIFTLGLICAATGWLHGRRIKCSARNLGETVRRSWGEAILESVPTAASHGLEAAWRYGAGGARAEAMLGFPTVREVGLPALRSALDAGCDRNRASVHVLFHLVGVLEDTNLLYRGKREGLRFARESAARFLARGSVHQANWREEASRIHREFVERDLSPGGSADLLAATLLVHELETRAA
jgi:triphosphoribosyl-dephospho-CoA synthase